MKTKKYLSVSLLLLVLLTACGGTADLTSEQTSSSKADISSSVSDTTSSSQPADNRTVQEKVEKAIDDAIYASNYTLRVEQTYSSFCQYYTENSFIIQTEDDEAYQGYVKDDVGVYEIDTKDGEEITADYYIYDSDNDENLADLYSYIYSLSDLELDPSDYGEYKDCYYLENMDSSDAYNLFVLCGYNPSSTTYGSRLSDVSEMRFSFTGDTMIFEIEFNEQTSSEGIVTMTLEDIGGTSTPSSLQSFLDKGGKGKKKVSEDDELFTQLISLKNMRNFTINVRSDYSYLEGFSNYTMTAKYTNTAYYSYTDRASEEDVGAVETEEGLKNLIYDEINDSYIVGDLITDSSGNSIKSLYSYVQSFRDLYFNTKDFHAQKLEDGYLIEDEDFIVDVFNLFDETMLKFMLQSMTFTFDTDSMHFVANIMYGDKIYMDITDINKTVIEYTI